MPKAVLPASLIRHVRDGRTVLFIGSEVLQSVSDDIPETSRWAGLLSDHFLDGRFSDRGLAQVVEIVESEHSRNDVQSFIANRLSLLAPTPMHRLISDFTWKGIITTSPSLIIERAYGRSSNQNQQLVVFTKNGQSVESKMRSNRTLMMLKLHGCVSKLGEDDPPLILCTEQYVTHSQGRDSIFNRATEWFSESPICFIGRSSNDEDVRAHMHRWASSSTKSSRSYAIIPSMADEEIRYWESRRISCIAMDLSGLMQGLAGAISKNERTLARLITHNHADLRRFLNIEDQTAIPSDIEELLEHDVEFVHQSMTSRSADPKEFYKGRFVGWPNIFADHDIRRSLYDAVFEDVFLQDESQRQAVEFVVLLGHAGSGKTVSLTRLAWEAANSGAMCLFAKQGAFFNLGTLFDLIGLVNRRVYLFVDNAAERRNLLRQLHARAKDHGTRITMLSAERHNTWNDSCEEIEAIVTRRYKMRYLSEKEIRLLLEVLKRHDSLGQLQEMSEADQFEEFKGRAERQLLVALHEATLGKSFAEIIFDEYNSISSPVARDIYGTVAIFHSMKIKVRAGLISRIHAVPFEQFNEELHRPLEKIVFVHRDIDGDYCYATRHPHIAEIVVEMTMTDPRERAREYNQIISVLDLDYSDDRSVLWSLTRAGHLYEVVGDSQLAREIYQKAHVRLPHSPRLTQQESMYNMKVGDLPRASQLIDHALELDPDNDRIRHTYAEILLRKAEATDSQMLKDQLRKKAETVSREIINEGRAQHSHAHHTILKSKLQIIKEQLGKEGVADAIVDFEQSLRRAKDRFPGDPYILVADAEFGKLVDESERVLTALRAANKANSANSYVACRLARVLQSLGKTEEAVHVLEICTDETPQDRMAWFLLADLVDDGTPPKRAKAKAYLRNSFMKGDANYEAQYRYARSEFLDGRTDEAASIFRYLKHAEIPYRERSRIRDIESDSSRGSVTLIESGYAFAKLDGYGGDIFISRRAFGGDWEELRKGRRIRFRIGFSYMGASAVEMSLE